MMGNENHLEADILNIMGCVEKKIHVVTSEIRRQEINI